ncbi:TonB-dependent receptor [Pseudoalteromonas sp. A25]|uniref:TonB-dependent receptor n=1 Tax=Pseudoalteromonas sp. A25 TaxID=116092 RepID=UPI001260EA17|nr:TonB-dependent receptor [Pseudoalteromonas sp. A25]BBN83223.1 TonB-dependent receptor [Pseudoalteromonas sp. A25]
MPTVNSIQIINITAGVLLSCSALAISAPTDEQHQAQRFDANHFSQFNAQHALDIVTLTPGFVLHEGDAQRGLANTSGNVLINGIPAQSKTQSLRDLLEKISIDQIEFIDFYPSNHPFSSVSHHTQAINIKVNHVATAVDIQTSYAVRDNKRSLAELSTQIHLPWQDWQHQLSLKAHNSRYESDYLAKEFNQQSVLQGLQAENFIEQLQEVKLSTLSTLGNDQGSLQVTSQFWSERWQTDFVHTHFVPNDSTPYARNYTVEWLDMDEYQLGADWQTTLFDTFELQLTGLTTDNKQAKTIAELNVQTAPFLQSKHHKEYAAQLSIQATSWHLEPQWGIEFSYNQLRAQTQSATQFISNQVSETRYQPFAAINWKITDAWQLYSKLNVEFAALNTNAQHAKKLTERHIKPLLRLTYESPKWQVNWQFKQHVEQLDFGLFVVSQDISFDRVQLGNNNIKPSRYSELSMQLNYAPNEHITINNTVFTQWQRDIHESMQLTETDEGIANAGRARLNGINAVIDIKTDFLLLNSTVTFDYQYRHAQFDDPLGGVRAINALTPHALSAEFRHNYDTLSWGIEYIAKQRETEYFVTEKSVVREGPSTSLFIEMPIADKTQLRLAANAIEKEKTRYWQQFYQPTRAGRLDGYQVINESVEPELRLTLRSQL